MVVDAKNEIGESALGIEDEDVSEFTSSHELTINITFFII